MALSFSAVRDFKAGHKGGLRGRIVDVTLDSSYVAGGWALTAANFRLESVLDLVSPPAFKSGYGFEFDQSASTLKAYTGGLVEADASDAGLNGLVLRCLAYGV